MRQCFNILQDEATWRKRSTNTPRNTSSSQVAQFDARFRGPYGARLSLNQRQNCEFDVDFPNFSESGVVLEEVVRGWVGVRFLA